MSSSDTSSHPLPLRPAIVLVKPREEGNIGAVARAMANMGLHRLILVEPAPQLGGTARGFGVGGWQVLDHCERYTTFEEAIASFPRLVGTASMRHRPLKDTPPIPARDLAPFLAKDPPHTETAVVFGCESSGLSRRELERCHPIVSIPCDAEQPTLNLAQAVLIVAYELSLARRDEPLVEISVGEEGDALASPEDMETLLQGTSKALRRIGYDQQHIHLGLLRDLRRLAARARISGREARILRRLLNRAHSFLGGPRK